MQAMKRELKAVRAMRQAARVFISAGLAALLVPAGIALVSQGSVRASSTGTTSTEAAVSQIVDPNKIAVPDGIPELSQPTPVPAPGAALPGKAVMLDAGSTATLQEGGAPLMLPALPKATPPAAIIAATPVQLEAEETPQPAKAKTKIEMSEAGEEIESLDLDASEAGKLAEPSKKRTQTTQAQPPRRPPSGRVAGTEEGATLQISGRVTGTGSAQNGDMRVKLRTSGGEDIVALVPPWPGMRFPSAGGTYTVRA
jgi:hypothetical protein